MMKDPDGKTYSTTFVLERLFQDGTYTGTINEMGERQGKGTMKYVDGKTYTGSFQNNLPHGQGKSEITQGLDKYEYEGGFLEGIYHGHGTAKITIGGGKFEYKGEFLGGVYHGNGLMKFPSGNIFRGQFHKGALEEGTMEYADGKAAYTGKFLNGLPQKEPQEP